jgi:hypothetical protein
MFFFLHEGVCMRPKRLELCPEPALEEPPTVHLQDRRTSSDDGARKSLASGDFPIRSNPLPDAPPRSAWREAGEECAESNPWPESERTMPSTPPPPIESNSQSVTVQQLGPWESIKTVWAKIHDEWQLVILVGGMLFALILGFSACFLLMGKTHPIPIPRP